MRAGVRWDAVRIRQDTALRVFTALRVLHGRRPGPAIAVAVAG